MALTGGGPAGATETLATQVYNQAFALRTFGGGAALALVLAAIILIFAVIHQRLTRTNPEDSPCSATPNSPCCTKLACGPWR